MKKLIRLSALLISLLIVVSAFASCGETTDQTETTTAASTNGESTEAKTEQFPEANYNGDTFTVYAREASEYGHYGIYASEQTGEVINDQTLIRNQVVEQKYNIKFALKTAKNPSDNLGALIQSDCVDFDVILDERNIMASAITSGLLGDWNSLGINMDNSWWDKNCAEGYDINGKLYYAVNDVSVSNLSGARYLYFNKQLVNNYSLTSPYEYVTKNEWTLDNFISLVKQVSNPSTDASTVGVYGMLRETGANNGNHMHLYTACGISMIKWVDGEMTSNIDESTVTKLQDITDRLKEVFNTNYTLTYSEVNKIDKSTGYAHMYDKGRGNFATGHFLFVQNGMDVSSQFQDMTDGFGVVPNPKYNTDQEEYYHKVDKWDLLWAFPNSASVDTGRLATVMDYWAYTSKTTVMSSYYDLLIKSRNVDEATACANLDIIKNSIAYEIGDIFNIGIATAFNTGFESGNMSSQFTTAGVNSINASLQKINATLQSIG